MKKFVSIALSLVMVLALAVSAMASGVLRSDSDSWFFDADEAGILVAKDNFKEYSFDVIEGENFLGLQRDYTGQLTFISFEAAETEHACDFVKALVGPVNVNATIENVPGNTNPYTFTITEEFEWVCECGNALDNTFEDSSFDTKLDNNYKGNVEVGAYMVYIYSTGNIVVEDLYIK